MQISCVTKEFRNTFTASNLNLFRGSKQSLNSNFDNQTFNATGGSLPVTPSRTRSLNDLQKNPRRAKSNENLKNNDYSPNSTGSKSQQSISKINGSKNSKHMAIEDYSSDSDEQ
jgi:hypothetical protein